MGTLCGFAPWIVFWALVGNVPFAIAAVMALVIAAVALVIGRINGTPARWLEIGSLGTFSVLTVLTLGLGHSFVAQWALPLSIAGALAVALAAVLSGQPLLSEPTASGTGTDATRNELVGELNARVTRIWAATFAAMAVSTAIPPIVLTSNGITDASESISIAFSWVVPLGLFCGAALASRVLEDRVTARLASPETVRRTTFVAFRELAIDELYYLAREKAAREVGAGMEAYDVKLGGAGVSLTGDESRESWPATYKVRALR